MELEFFDFPVQNVVFGEKTALEGTVLTINREEMARQIDPDGFFSDVQIDIARPGEAVRIINIMDVMQPRCKESDAESPYPGMFSSMQLAGTGRTYVLQGVSVMQTGRRQGIQEGIIDMSGPGAAYSLFSSLCNVVLRCTPADPNASNSDFDAATRKSLLAAALYLGKTARGQQPGSVRTFSTDTPVDPHLRKVVYIYYLQSQGPLRNTFLYGKDVTSLLPTLLHPNEVMDGAIVSGNYIIACQKNPTYLHLNNPVIRELYARHGKTLDFAGVVIANEHSTLFDKRRTAEFAAKLARQIGAEGVVMTQEGGGHADSDLMFCTRACAAQGIPSVMLINELAGPEGDQPSLVDTTPLARHVVSTGNNHGPWRGLPAQGAGCLPAVLHGTGADVHGHEPAGSLQTFRHGILMLRDALCRAGIFKATLQPTERTP